MNRAARIIITGNLEHDIHGIELLKQLGLMKLKERRDYFKSLLVFICVNGIAPSYLCGVLTPADSIRTRGSRSNVTADNYMCHMSIVTFVNNPSSTGRRRSGSHYLVI